MSKIIFIRDFGQSEVIDYDAVCKFQEDNQTERLPNPIPRIPLNRKRIRFALKELRKEGHEVKFLDKRRFKFVEYSVLPQFRFCNTQLNQCGVTNLMASNESLRSLNKAEQFIFSEC